MIHNISFLVALYLVKGMSVIDIPVFTQKIHHDVRATQSSVTLTQ